MQGQGGHSGGHNVYPGLSESESRGDPSLEPGYLALRDARARPKVSGTEATVTETAHPERQGRYTPARGR